MIIIKLGFLLGLPLAAPIPSPSKLEKKTKKSKGDSKSSKSKKSKSKTSKKSSKKSSKSSKKSKKSKASTESKKVKETPPLPEYAYEVGKPEGFFHIEYTLFPHLEPCHIDVLHWEVISKIYFQAKTVIYRNMIRDNTIWIPIMLEHKITEPLSEDQLLELKNFVVEFVVSPNKKKMSADAKNEKCKLFFIKEEDITNDCYVEAFEEDPNLGNELKSQNRFSNFSKKSARLSIQEMHSIIKQFDFSLLHHRFQKLLDKLKREVQISFKQYVPPSPPPLPAKNIEVEPDENDANNYSWPKAKKGKTGKKGAKNKKQNKKDKKSKSSKKSKSGKSGKSKKSKKSDKKPPKLKKEAKIKVSGESYFTDAALCTYRLCEEVENISDLFVVFSTWNLTTPEMICSLRPIVIKLKSLRNLPVDYLIEQKFSSIYLQYNIPNIGSHITQPITLNDLKYNKKININESHIFLKIPFHDLISFVLCNRLIIELIGVYNDEADLTPSLFGSEKSDFVRIPPDPSEYIYPKPKSLILAVACYDLSLFMHSRKNLELIEPLRHPSNSNSQRGTAPYQNLNFIRPLNIEYIHLNVKRDHHPSPLIDGILFEEDTTLKLQVTLGCKLDRLHLPRDDNVVKYKRLLLIIYDLDIASYLLSDILCYNQVYRKSVLVKNFNMYAETIQNIKETDPSGQILTGFWIDSGNSIIIFIESCRANYCMEVIIYQVKCMNESLCRTYHNTAMYFYDRIYENFLTFGGIYKITLKYELQKIFQAQWTHITKYVPKPAFEAIKKLQYLLEMPTMLTMNQHGVFPTVNELLSFDMEFGVPHNNDKLY